MGRGGEKRMISGGVFGEALTSAASDPWLLESWMTTSSEAQGAAESSVAVVKRKLPSSSPG